MNNNQGKSKLPLSTPLQYIRGTRVLRGSDHLISELPATATAVVGMVRSLLGSGRHGQVTLYLFQKDPLSWEQACIVYRNGIASVP